MFLVAHAVRHPPQLGGEVLLSGLRNQPNQYVRRRSFGPLILSTAMTYRG